MFKIKTFIAALMTAVVMTGNVMPVKASPEVEVAHFHTYDELVYCGVDYENMYTHDVLVIDQGSETHTSNECFIIEQHEVYKLKCECGAVYNGYTRIKVICDHSICDNEVYWLN